MSARRPPRRGPASAALAASLALGTCPLRHISAAPSERDLAYEQAVQADVAGDHALAAAYFERAYRLTAPAESGPRLLFLRAGVAARLRAAETGDPRLHLCPARALLREHLGPLPGSADGADAERDSLTRVEAQLQAAGAPDCDARDDPPPTAPPTAPPTDPRDAPKPEPRATDPATTPAAPRPAPGPTADAPRRPHLALKIAGGVGLGVGVASFVVLGVGVALADRASDRGRAACWAAPVACEGNVAPIRDIVADGKQADLMVRLGAALGGLGVAAGVVLLGLGARKPRRAPVALRPTLGPGTAGAALSARF